MFVEPVPGVEVRVFDTGWMELAPPGGGDHLLCDEVGTAMWIALCQESWNIGDAASCLAQAWDSDPWSVRDMMNDWLDDLCHAGLVAP